MRAVRFHEYGLPSVLRVEDVARPQPKASEVCVRVVGSSLNAADIGGRTGSVRLIHARTLPHTPGYDVAGTIEACGEAVTAFVPGEAVFAMTGLNAGGHAEYVCLAQEKVARAPERVSLAAAGTVPLAGLTALQGLRAKGHIQAGQRVLVNGATGGVGMFAVQLAKIFGCHVTAVCRGDKAADALALGADEVIDYTRDDFAKLAESWDVVFDAAGNRMLRDVQAVLNPHGVMVVTRPAAQDLVASVPFLPGTRPRYTFLITKASGHDLSLLARLIDRGELKPLIDRTFTIDQIQEAHLYYERGGARGKIAVQVAL